MKYFCTSMVATLVAARSVSASVVGISANYDVSFVRYHIYAKPIRDVTVFSIGRVFLAFSQHDIHRFLETYDNQHKAW